MHPEWVTLWETLTGDAHQYRIHCIVDNKTVGSCLVLVYRNSKAKVMLVDDVSIDEQHRGKGYGTRLMESVLESARIRNVDSVELTVNLDNEVARNLYRKMGFEETEKKYCRRILNRWTDQPA